MKNKSNKLFSLNIKEHSLSFIYKKITKLNLLKIPFFLCVLKACLLIVWHFGWICIFLFMKFSAKVDINSEGLFSISPHTHIFYVVILKWHTRMEIQKLVREAWDFLREMSIHPNPNGLMGSENA